MILIKWLAADPWSLTINLAKNRGAGGGRAAPPRTPLLFWGAPPPGPPKRRSAPLAAAVVRFLATEPLVRGSCAAWGRTFSLKSDFFGKKPLVPGSFAAWGKTFSQNDDCFGNYGTPVRSTNRRKFQKMHFQKFWDSCAHNKTSEISKNTFPGILGLLWAEQNVGNLKKCPFRNSGAPVRRTKRRKSQKVDFQEFWDSCAQNKTSEI